MAHETALKDVYALFKTALVKAGYPPEIYTIISYYYSWDSAAAQSIVNAQTDVGPFIAGLRETYGDCIMLLNRDDSSSETWPRGMLLYFPRADITNEIVLFACGESWNGSQAVRRIVLMDTDYADDLNFCRTFFGLFKAYQSTIQFEKLPHPIDVIKSRASVDGLFTVDNHFSDVQMAGTPETYAIDYSAREIASHTTPTTAI